MYRSKKKIMIGVLCVAVFVMVIGFAAFSTRLNISGTSSIESNWKVVFTNIQELSKTNGVTINNTPTASGTTATFDVSLESPGDAIEYQITVENQGTLDAIIEDIEASENGSDAIKFEISNIRIGDILLKQASTTFNIKISYNENVISQPNITNNKLTVDISYVQNVGQEINQSDPEISSSSIVSNILKDNVAQSDASIDFSKTSEEDGTKGLYYTNKNTEEGKTVYYYRGAVENNYVKFGSFHEDSCTYNGQAVFFADIENNISSETPTEEQCLSTNVCGVQIEGIISANYVGLTDEECSMLGGTVINQKATFEKDKERNYYWRIIRVNEDSSIRIIYQGKYSYAIGNLSKIGDSAFNDIYKDNAYVGYMYGKEASSTYEETHANVNNSSIKTVLDNWYEENLLSYESYIADSGFCGDRSLSSQVGIWNSDDTGLGYGRNRTFYGAYYRLLYEEEHPQFLCPQRHDLYTVSNSKGNQALNYPIGLITADEAIYAGGSMKKYFHDINSVYYLYTGYDYWTMTPGMYGNSESYNIEVSRNGKLTYNLLHSGQMLGVRPVINLKSNVEIIQGDGTSSNPYVIKVN